MTDPEALGPVQVAELTLTMAKAVQELMNALAPITALLQELAQQRLQAMNPPLN